MAASVAAGAVTLDDEVLREVWVGTIAVAFVLHPADVGTLERPPPYFLALPRYAYVSMYASEIRQHFAPYAAALGKSSQELWFTAQDHAQTPLRWTWPVGVLYDLLGDAATPWTITVHTSAYPTERLLRCPDEDTVKSHFLHSLKEAVFLRHGDVDVVNELSVAHTTDLWAGILRNEMERYWRVNKQIAAHARKKPWRSLAVRLVRLPSGAGTGARALVQEPVAPLTKDGREVTLGEVLRALAPDTLEPSSEHDAPRLRADTRVLVQGIAPPLDASAVWLAAHLASTDNFLYVVVVQSDAERAAE